MAARRSERGLNAFDRSSGQKHSTAAAPQCLFRLSLSG
jgi:hypothetical protein